MGILQGSGHDLLRAAKGALGASRGLFLPSYCPAQVLQRP